MNLRLLPLTLFDLYGTLPAKELRDERIAGKFVFLLT